MIPSRCIIVIIIVGVCGVSKSLETELQKSNYPPGFYGFHNLALQLADIQKGLTNNATKNRWEDALCFITTNNPYQDPADYAPDEGFEKSVLGKPPVPPPYGSSQPARPKTTPSRCLERYHVCHAPLYDYRYDRRFFHKIDYHNRARLLTSLNFGRPLDAGSDRTVSSSPSADRMASLSNPDQAMTFVDGPAPPPQSSAFRPAAGHKSGYGGGTVGYYPKRATFKALVAKASGSITIPPSHNTLVLSHSFAFNERVYLIVSQSNRISNPMGQYGLESKISVLESRSDPNLGSNPDDVAWDPANPTLNLNNYDKNSNDAHYKTNQPVSSINPNESPVTATFDRILTHVYWLEDKASGTVSPKIPNSTAYSEDYGGVGGGKGSQTSSSSLSLLAHIHKYPSYKSSKPSKNSNPHDPEDSSDTASTITKASSSHFVFSRWGDFHSPSQSDGGDEKLFLTFLSTTRTLLLSEKQLSSASAGTEVGGGGEGRIKVMGIELDTYVEVYNVLSDGYVDLFKRKYIPSWNGMKPDAFEIFTLPAAPDGGIDGRKRGNSFGGKSLEPYSNTSLVSSNPSPVTTGTSVGSDSIDESGGGRGRKLINNRQPSQGAGIGGGAGKPVYAVLVGRPGLRGLTRFSSGSSESQGSSRMAIYRWNHISDDFVPFVDSFQLPVSSTTTSRVSGGGSGTGYGGEDGLGSDNNRYQAMNPPKVRQRVKSLKLFSQRSKILILVIQELVGSTASGTGSSNRATVTFLTSILSLESKGSAPKLTVLQHLPIDKPSDVYEVVTDTESDDRAAFIVMRDQLGDIYLFKYVDQLFNLAKIWREPGAGLQQFFALIPNPATTFAGSDYRGEELLISVLLGQDRGPRAAQYSASGLNLIFRRIREASTSGLVLGKGSDTEIAGIINLPVPIAKAEITGTGDFIGAKDHYLGDAGFKINALVIKDKIYVVVDSKGKYSLPQASATRYPSTANTLINKGGECAQDGYSSTNECSTKAIDIYGLNIQVKPSVDPTSAENLKILALLDKMDDSLRQLEDALRGIEYALEDIYIRDKKASTAGGKQQPQVVKLSNKIFLGRVNVRGAIKVPNERAISSTGRLELVAASAGDWTGSDSPVYGLPRFDSNAIRAARVCERESRASLAFVGDNLGHVIRSTDRGPVVFSRDAILNLNGSSSSEVRLPRGALNIAAGSSNGIRSVNGIGVKELDGAIRHKNHENRTHVFDVEVVFKNDFVVEGDLTTDNVNGIDLSTDALTTNTVQELEMPIRIDSDVSVSPNLQVDHGINGVELSQFLDLNQASRENRTISFEKLEVLGDIHVHSGILNGAKFVEFLDTVFLLDQPQTLTGIKQLTQATLFTKPIVISGMFNGKNVSGIIEHAIKLDGTEEQVISWPHVTFNGPVDISKDLRVEKLLNKFTFTEYLVTKGVQTFTSPITFERESTFNGPIVKSGSGYISGLGPDSSRSDWILNDGSTITIDSAKVFESPTVFESGINVASAGGLIDGTSITQLRNVVQVDPRGTVGEWDTDLEFNKAVTFKGQIRCGGDLNGVDLSRHFESVLNKSSITGGSDRYGETTEIILTGTKHVVGSRDGKGGPTNFQQPLKVLGLINGYDLGRDLWAKSSGPSPTTTTTVVVDSSIRIQGPVAFHGNLDVDGRIDEVEWKRFLENRISLSKDQVIGQHRPPGESRDQPSFIFNGAYDTTFASNLSLGGRINSDLDPNRSFLYVTNPESLTINGNKTIVGDGSYPEQAFRVEHKTLVIGDATIRDGLYNGHLNLSDCLDRRLTLSTDQTYHVSPPHTLVAGRVELLKNLNLHTLNRHYFDPFVRNILTSNTAQTFAADRTITFKSPVVVGSGSDLVSPRTVNGLDMVTIMGGSINLTQPSAGPVVMEGRYVFGTRSQPITFVGDVSLPTGAQNSEINGISFGPNYANRMLPSTPTYVRSYSDLKQDIRGVKTFAEGFNVAHGPVWVSKVNGDTDFPGGFLSIKDVSGGVGKYEPPTPPRGQVTNLVFAKSVKVLGKAEFYETHKVDEYDYANKVEKRASRINGQDFSKVFGRVSKPKDGRDNLIFVEDIVFKSDVTVNKKLTVGPDSTVNHLNLSELLSGAILSTGSSSHGRPPVIVIRGKKRFADRGGSHGDIKFGGHIEVADGVDFNGRHLPTFVGDMIPCHSNPRPHSPNLDVNGPVRVTGNLMLHTEDQLTVPPAQIHVTTPPPPPPPSTRDSRIGYVTGHDGGLSINFLAKGSTSGYVTPRSPRDLRSLLPALLYTDRPAIFEVDVTFEREIVVRSHVILDGKLNGHPCGSKSILSTNGNHGDHHHRGDEQPTDSMIFPRKVTFDELRLETGLHGNPVPINGHSIVRISDVALYGGERGHNSFSDRISSIHEEADRIFTLSGPVQFDADLKIGGRINTMAPNLRESVISVHEEGTAVQEDIYGRKCFSYPLKLSSARPLRQNGEGVKVLGVDLVDVGKRGVPITRAGLSAKYANGHDLATPMDRIVGVKVNSLEFIQSADFEKNLEVTGQVNGITLSEFVEAIEEYANFVKLNVAKSITVQDDQCDRMNLLEGMCQNSIYYLSYFKVDDRLNTSGASNFQIFPVPSAAAATHAHTLMALKIIPHNPVTKIKEFTDNDFCTPVRGSGKDQREEGYVNPLLSYMRSSEVHPLFRGYELVLYDVLNEPVQTGNQGNSLHELFVKTYLTSTSSHIDFVSFSLRKEAKLPKPYLAQLGCGPLVLYALNNKKNRDSDSGGTEDWGLQVKHIFKDIGNVKSLSVVHIDTTTSPHSHNKGLESSRVTIESGNPPSYAETGDHVTDYTNSTTIRRDGLLIVLVEELDDRNGSGTPHHVIRIYRLCSKTYDTVLVHSLKPTLALAPAPNVRGHYGSEESAKDGGVPNREKKLTKARHNPNDISHFRLFKLPTKYRSNKNKKSGPKGSVDRLMLVCWSTTRTTSLSPKAFVYGIGTRSEIEGYGKSRLIQFVLSYGVRDLVVVGPASSSAGTVSPRADVYVSAGFFDQVSDSSHRTRLIVASERSIRPTDPVPEIDIEIYDYVENEYHGAGEGSEDSKEESYGTFQKVQSFPERNVIGLSYFTMGNFPDIYIVVARSDNLLNIYHYKGIMGFEHRLSLRASGVKRVDPFFIGDQVYLSVFKEPGKSKFVKTHILKGVTLGHSFTPKKMVCDLKDRI